MHTGKDCKRDTEFNWELRKGGKWRARLKVCNICCFGSNFTATIEWSSSTLAATLPHPFQRHTWNIVSNINPFLRAREKTPAPAPGLVEKAGASWYRNVAHYQQCVMVHRVPHIICFKCMSYHRWTFLSYIYCMWNVNSFCLFIDRKSHWKLKRFGRLWKTYD